MKEFLVAASFWIFFALLGFVVGACAWTYTINTWLVYMGKDAALTWWQGGLIGLVPWIGYISLPAAALTYLIMLFIG